MENVISQMQKYPFKYSFKNSTLLQIFQPLTLEKYIDHSNIKEKNKKYYKNYLKNI